MEGVKKKIKNSKFFHIFFSCFLFYLYIHYLIISKWAGTDWDFIKNNKKYF